MDVMSESSSFPFGLRRRVAVYCAASERIDRKYFDFAKRLGGALGRQGFCLVYGGGASGLMGAVADAVLDAGGEVTGVMPLFMRRFEDAHPRLTRLVEVDTMHERKTAMVAQSDAIIALPGGCGTFEELLEAFTWKRLQLICHPIIVVNQDGYYDPLQALFRSAVDQGFLAKNFEDLWTFVETPEAAIESLLM